LLDLVFGRHVIYVLLVVLLSAAVFGGTGHLLRRRSDRPWAYAAWAASTTAALLLTLWVRTAATGAVMCVVNKDVWEPLGVAQGRMNIALFVPIGFFGLRAARRPVPPLLLSVLLSCGIESVQAVVPAIGRYCDTSDLVANVLGAVAGVGLGVLSVRLGGRRLPPWGPPRRRLPIAAGAGLTACACLLAATVEVRVVDHAEAARSASAEQRAAITDVVRRALGGDFRVTGVSDFTPCGVDGVNERAWAELEPDAGVEMTWPDRDLVTIDVRVRSTSLTQPPTGYPIPGATGPVNDPTAARRVAGRYVAARYPAEADATRPLVEEPEAESADMWTVAYPYRDPRMPAMKSLRVTLNRAGRLRGVRLSAGPPGDDTTGAAGAAEQKGGTCSDVPHRAPALGNS
jgi:hypothetical protein